MICLDADQTKIAKFCFVLREELVVLELYTNLVLNSDIHLPISLVVLKACVATTWPEDTVLIEFLQSICPSWFLSSRFTVSIKEAMTDKNKVDVGRQ